MSPTSLSFPPDKPYLGAGQSVSVSGGPRAAERRARDKSWVFRASLCDWKEDQGSPSENIHMAHLPPHPPQSSSLPETSRHTTGRRTRGERRDKKRFQAKCRLFFAAVCGAVVKICSCFWKKKKMSKAPLVEKGPSTEEGLTLSL